MVIYQIIEQKLRQAFTPTFLQVTNESYKHNVAEGSESHFNVTVVSSLFAEQRLLQRHRAVNTVLAEELAQHIHALAIHTYTPQEWSEQQAEQVPASPNCYGGGK
ncbi:transcriptional regulator BolA [Rheinheimera salexigens]|uniref:DNA-binding transcriptional regulator BolA n=1 Tax=Rheinheimera salexigens TaxID=1628148 RepID=A0A1E7Q4U4_9GAMM|nr:transcriptional regulator BolA [Rheinheimera salexigens]OEY69068.1 transcriptional regulator BolA [Rheinheimera salexigens]